jgi:hypothetical protein
MVTVDDCIEAEEVFKEDQGVQRVLRERYGIYDVNEVACDPWYYGQRYSAIPRYYTDLAHVGSGSEATMSHLGWSSKVQLWFGLPAQALLCSIVS